MNETQKEIEQFDNEFAKAIKRAGGAQADLAEICECTQQTVSYWSVNKSIPKASAKKIVEAFPSLSLVRLMGP